MMGIGLMRDIRKEFGRMKYTRLQCVRELWSEVEQGYDVDRLSNWAYAKSASPDIDIDDSELDSFLMTVVTMGEGPEFEYSETELRDMALRLLNGMKGAEWQRLLLSNRMKGIVPKRYTREQFALELLAEIEQGYDVGRLAEWAYAKMLDIDHETCIDDPELCSFVMLVVDMEQGGASEYSETELCDMAIRVLNGDRWCPRTPPETRRITED